MLEAQGLSLGYGSVPVIRDVDLVAEPGKVLLVLGPNGAGRSTLLKGLAGFLKPTRGRLILDGTDVTGEGAERLSRRGVRLILEGHRVFPELSVEDNLRLGQVAAPRRSRLPFSEVTKSAYDVFPILGEKRSDLAQSLSGGQQQMLALVQGWAARPQYLLCDEPSLGLAQTLIPQILSFLRARADEGAAVVLVEQIVELPLTIADEVVVIRQGEVASRELASKYEDSAELTRLVMGDHAAAAGGERDAP